MYLSLSQRKRRRTQPDWSALPLDCLEEISRRLLSCDDYFHFRSVCSTWRSAAPKRSRLPLLLVMTTTSIFSLPLTLGNFPDIELYTITSGWEHMICGSSHGWICLDLMMNSPIYLFNPFTGVDDIGLPVLPDHATPSKVVLSADPALEPDNCVVMANCFNGSVFYCRPGDASWTCAFNGYHDSAGDEIKDAMFYKGKAYVVSKFYRVFACHICEENAVFGEILPADPLFTGCKPVHTGTDTEMYLVVSSGDLLLAVVTFTNYRPSGCEVFRIDLDCGQLRLLKLQNLAGCAFFLSPLSMSLSIEISSATNKCKGNCIYYIGEGAGNYIFDVEDGSISALTLTETETWWRFLLWLTPSNSSLG